MCWKDDPRGDDSPIITRGLASQPPPSPERGGRGEAKEKSKNC